MMYQVQQLVKNVNYYPQRCYQVPVHTAHQMIRQKSRDELLEQGIVTLFKKPTDQEDGGLKS